MSRGQQFSVVLPVYNGGEHLKLCVASILRQTLADSFELIVLDNVSTDGTSEWLSSLRDPRVHLVPSERHLSIEENWARIKDVPKNEYVTIIGHDDLLDPDFLAAITALIHDYPDAGLYSTHFRLIDESGAFLRHSLPTPTIENASGFLAARLCAVRDSFGTGHVMLSAVYDAIGGIPNYPKLLYADDALFLQVIGASYHATALDEKFSYRHHMSSAAKKSAMKDLFDGLEQYGSLLTRMQEIDPELKKVLKRYFPSAAVEVGRMWRDEELLAAYRTRDMLHPSVDERIAKLVRMFEPDPVLPPPRRGYRSRLLEAATTSKIHRVLCAAMRAEQGVTKRVADWLLRAAVK